MALIDGYFTYIHGIADIGSCQLFGIQHWLLNYICSFWCHENSSLITLKLIPKLWKGFTYPLSGKSTWLCNRMFVYAGLTSAEEVPQSWHFFAVDVCGSTQFNSLFYWVFEKSIVCVIVSKIWIFWVMLLFFFAKTSSGDKDFPYSGGRGLSKVSWNA